MIRPALLREASSYTPDERLELIEVLLTGLHLDHVDTTRVARALWQVRGMRSRPPVRLVKP